MQARPGVAVDVVIFSIAGADLEALLVQVKDGPYRGRWAFPGGLLPRGEAPQQTAARELFAQTGIRDVYLEQLRTFGDPGRDRRAHIVSIAHFALVSARGEAVQHPKYAGVRWAPVRALPRLAYDHDQIARYALERLQAKLGYTNIVYSLMPPSFTLGELQHVYEVILGRELDRRNFRKKLGASGLLKPAAGVRRGSHRPAQLYRFASRAPMNVELL